MPGSAVNRGIIRFGIFEVELPAGRIRRNGLRIRLQDQPFQVLAMLLERPGEVVTREDLRARLWASDTFVDFDHGLNAAVKRLRDALGDSADNPRFVETLARRGYRFLAPVELPGEEPPAPETSAISNSPGSAWRLFAIGALVVILSIGLGLHLGMRFPRPAAGSPQGNPVDRQLRRCPCIFRGALSRRPLSGLPRSARNVLAGAGDR